MTTIPSQHEPCETEKCILSVTDALDVLSGRWKLPILVTLQIGSKRFRQSHGSSLGSVIAALQEWGELHRKKIIGK
jgi:DNA-binding HxlR family transcriptional regulator